MTKSVRLQSLESFYEEAAGFLGKDVQSLLPPGINKEVGHFNVFDVAETIRAVKKKQGMPYNRRAYYKISLIRGRNRAEYADKVIQVEQNALLFATPKVPYNWIPQDENQGGLFCVFTADFFMKSRPGNKPEEIPVFRSGAYPVFELSNEEADEAEAIFLKMKKEITSDYIYKYDLIRNYISELIHYGQKFQPAASLAHTQNAAERIVSLFIELLERQFPVESPNHRLQLRSAKEYADALAVHVNHLNKVLREISGKTTTEFISGRIAAEAKILLKQTSWSVSEIAYSLGFEEVAHFSNFFKKLTGFSPLSFRN